MHLVVLVSKCEGLAIADEDKGVSSPFLRVSWDNMMQTSFVLKETIRPTFNHAFYFPVRFFNDKVTSRKYFNTAFLYEMRSNPPRLWALRKSPWQLYLRATKSWIAPCGVV